MARLAKLASGNYEERATDLEVALYCSSASLSRPPSEDEFHIYMYAFRKVYGDEMADASIGKDEGRKLEEYTEKRAYDGLAEWIYRKQKGHLKEKSKVQEKQVREAGAKPASSGKIRVTR